MCFSPSKTRLLLSFCRELECVPDIWGLLEWSDWLTPRNLPIRYDTLFYVCFIDTQPPVEGDGEEIVDAQVRPCGVLHLNGPLPDTLG